MTPPPQLDAAYQARYEQGVSAGLSAEVAGWLAKTAACSPWFDELLTSAGFAEVAGWVTDPQPAEAELDALSADWVLDEPDRVKADLRGWRNRQMAWLMVQDANGLSSARKTARAVSDLADVAIRRAVTFAEAHWTEQWGAPGPSDFEEQQQSLVVVAMGKHGARELNLSSDIDLIFAFPNQGEVVNGRSHEEFFTRVGRTVIQLLDTRTPEGFVFRVDMRLRPWGQSGALVSNFAAMNHYYTHQGREWERFAMVKARPVTGARAAQAALEQDLKSFVYRRYVDFHALGALRRLKSMIQKEVRRQQLEDNIKLGQGGIREVEFIAQAFQLIRGGQDVSLQERGTWPVLTMLADEGYLPAEVTRELVDAYTFLRDLEHRIQALRDEQTQRLPADETDRARLAWSMGHNSIEALLEQLAHHRERVHHHFQQVVAEDAGSTRTLNPDMVALWRDGQSDSTDIESSETQAVLAFRNETAVQRLQGQARDNLDQLMPLLLTELAGSGQLGRGFEALHPILEAILRRSVYFVLLAENPDALHQLCRLAPASPWIANLFIQKPYLLDELSDPDSLYRLPQRGELTDDLHQTLLRVPGDDLEQQMEVLRHFRHGRVLRAAACEVAAMLPLMKISDYLAWVGEVVVEQALALAWQQMVSKHGRPSRDNGDWCELDFGVVAYGKMGGLELSYESDLDLVFLHQASPQGETEGPKVIDNVVFMARLGQRLIHLLSTATPSGTLYEVDTRLRPSGNSGLLVTSLKAFEKYQNSKAWTWEHQALVRARFIAGDPELQTAFNAVRHDILQRPRDRATLREDVIQMRRKMVGHLSSQAQKGKAGEVFHIKQDPGGIVDLEFLVQYLVLAYASDHPDVARWSDNVRCIKALRDAGVLTDEQAEQWLDAYLTLREHTHHAVLSGTSTTVPVAQMTPELARVRQLIRDQWQQWLGAESPAEQGD
ncbi:bifunctional [glutamate--ammonia ligase]-adenylyl-L-tyrosine phosphorylase/[glutamate--ammonia-ligase] adenylyltransferase [Saccharospirillum impatiens]|uniref:bifunctional [glutamate--ammonia ligase]-adenylyl-L-tyrosine phosphorylase/[glutamate--ammonia-ligase] adenylyltransferase n=1 Tax=Saccharospirillum impatiens TaxID=169438 RepID=UPI0004034259|nr:bifunctional [glutamate--ammonia ligase]-adenylyl-L-tyrosine phosphorylase/[glutamate--ammonia-ligase] adenylyltransferase [Saccharospirillum impatiens]